MHGNSVQLYGGRACMAAWWWRIYGCLAVAHEGRYSGMTACMPGSSALTQAHAPVWPSLAISHMALPARTSVAAGACEPNERQAWRGGGDGSHLSTGSRK
eukprot:360600-Chlamydomonas_euryale.AAC.6